ncbi:retinol dehydrogenase 7-like isoform X1 [Hemicordylus capensis]|uniref:retinol dehydrogenase 7-like isoform X1 n=1 Tax=Hemicordylus capensis TaxID=884348 RepID=UPI0023047CEE|nr:retinol dehydrogenase 7-like isoform X1 [Hemicordylus capensis]
MLFRLCQSPELPVLFTERPNEAEARNKRLVQVPRLKEIVGTFGGCGHHCYSFFIALVLSGGGQIGILAVVLLLFICWFLRDNMREKDLRGKYIFITGCDSGFGNALAKHLDKEGFHVIAACLSEEGSQELEASTSLSLKTVVLNLTDSCSVDKAVEFVRAETEGVGLYGLVNNAGRSMPMAPTDWLQIEEFHKTLDVNLMGLIEITLKLLPLLKKSKGRIVNVSSVLGRLAFIGGGYCVSKWGVEAFSDSLRRDMHHFGVKVSIIEPGFFKTGVTNLEVIEIDLLRLWNQLMPEVRDSYGDKYFVEYLKMQRLSMKKLCDPHLFKVTKCMEHALTAKYPRARYGVGWDAKLLWLPLSYAPTFMSDMMLRMLFPVPAGRSNPASRFQIDV